MASFIRQLNMYGFRKVTNIENSGLRSEGDDIEFCHQFFVKGKASELEFIKRKVSLKIPTGRLGTGISHFKQDDMTDILQDMESLKGKQESVDTMLSTMQSENEALWREVTILRQKHYKQQQIVEKLIQFLVSLVQNRGVIGMKRKNQLMIDDTEGSRQKSRNKVMKTEYNQDFSADNPGSNGPIIHDITDDDIEDNIICAPKGSPIIAQISSNPQIFKSESSDCLSSNSLSDQLMSNTEPIESLNILDPLQQSIEELGLVADPSSQPIDVLTNSSTADVDSLLQSSLNTPFGSPSLITSDNQNPNETQNNIKDLVLSAAVNDQTVSPFNTCYLSDHVDGIDAELAWLQDQLSSGINIDTSTLLGLFSSDDNNSQSQSPFGVTSGQNQRIVGNEVIEFKPNPNSNTLLDDLVFETLVDSNEDLLPTLDVVNEGTVSFPPDSGP